MPPLYDEDIVLTPYYETADGETARFYHGDVRDIPAYMPSGSVHCVITSPPYFGLRNYGNDEREIGSEKTPQQYVENLVGVFKELRRVLRLDGTLWLNLGDSYATATKGSGGNKGASTLQMDGRSDHARITGARRAIERQKSEARKFHYDVPDGSLLGIPWMVAFALQESGWILRQDIIWHKLGALPEPATNRCVNNYEHVFLFARNAGYYFDHIAIAEKSASEPYANRNSHLDGSRNDQGRKGEVWGTGLTNKRSVWSIANCNPEASKRHFACVDEETEALTKFGWKKHSDLTDGDEIAAYDKDLDMTVWQKASFQKYDYEGEMVLIEKLGTSQCLTPNHRCLVREPSKYTTTRLNVIRADCLSNQTDLMVQSSWGNKGSMSVGEDFAELVGWYAAEGGYKDGIPDGKLYQSLSANKDNVERIRELLVNLKADYTETHRHRSYRDSMRHDVIFRIKGEIRNKLRESCPNKMLPIWCSLLPYNEAVSMLTGMVGGDGSSRADGRHCIIQKCKEASDRIQILALRCGWQALLKKKIGESTHIVYLTEGRFLTVRGTNGLWKRPEKIRYKGVVWCPSVPSGFWLARRKGCPFITGNSFPPKLIEPMILAGTSEYGCCVKCGSPYRRVIEKEKARRERSNDRVKRNGEEGTGNVCDNSVAGVYVTTKGWKKTCVCDCDEVMPCTVLDPFLGTGTTITTAITHGRNGIGIELNEDYLKHDAVPRVRKLLLSRPAWRELA